MKKFSFKLEKLLRVREHAEEQAKEEFRKCHQAVLAVEREIADLDEQVERLMVRPCETIAERIQAEEFILCLKEDRASRLAALSIVEQEEEAALAAWRGAKQESEIVRTLKENAFAEWKEAYVRAEQTSLDEWAVMARRAS